MAHQLVESLARQRDRSLGARSELICGRAGRRRARARATACHWLGMGW